ncbi:hypothetical protein F2Q68_00045559 [Brassica cretica]|uniref:glycerophosphodiester phosphodiesterase n=1 Tax=Brassica cretica TaxID=69181 RepID=A0A8S9LEP9_BRACR|nr:hypothetical protein F2Q68_00045559 [Brassica cretica]
MGATSPERHREVAVTPLQSDLVRATPRCRSRFHRSEARERPYQSDAEKSLAFSSLAFSSLGGTRATRSDVSQRPLQVAPEAWSDLSERLLEKWLFFVFTECFPLIWLSLLTVCAGRTPYPLPGKRAKGDMLPIQTSRPYNIAHRGSNGEIPEETAAAYLRAIEEGTDFIETDILSSKDGVLICFHDVILDETANIASHKMFADRKRTYEVQGFNITGFFTFDFTLKELKKLRTKQRYSFRDQQYNGKYPIITFEEFITIARDAPRVVSIYPEIKNPVLINQHVKWPGGKRFEDKVVETLKKYGYGGSYLSKKWLKRPLFIQSFAPSSLVYISNLIDSPKVLLIDDVTVLTEDTNQTYAEITSDVYFNYIKQYVVGIGPWKDTVVPVHPYTYRNENEFLHLNFSQDPYKEYEYWINEIGVDGLFNDFTGSLHNYQEWTSPLSETSKSPRQLLSQIASLVLPYAKA